MKLFKFTALLILIPLIFGACNGMNSNTELSTSPILERIAARGKLIGIGGSQEAGQIFIFDKDYNAAINHEANEEFSTMS